MKCRMCGIVLNELNSVSDDVELCEQCRQYNERKDTIAIWLEGCKIGRTLREAKVILVRVHNEKAREPKQTDPRDVIHWIKTHGYEPFKADPLDTSRGISRTWKRLVFRKEVE